MAAKKEWKTETLSEVKAGKSQVWRLQRSTSPNGEEFIGIRRFTVRGDDYMPDRNGLTLKMEDFANFKRIIGLMKDMQSEMKGYDRDD